MHAKQIGTANEANLLSVKTFAQEAIVGSHGELRVIDQTAFRHCDFREVDNLTVDHIVPPSRGGSEHPSNCVDCCWSCNSKKHDRTADEYRAWLAAKGE